MKGNELKVPASVTTEVQTITKSASLCQVTSDVGYARAGELVVEIGTAIARAEEQRKSFTRPLDELKKRWMDLFAEPINKMKEAKGQVDSAMLDYRHAKEEAARELAEEQARLLREQQAKELRKQGDKEAAKDLMKAPLVVVPLEANLPKAEGVAVRKVWGFRIVDASLIPRQYLVPDESVLKAIAQVRKEEAQVPGVKFYFTESVGRTGR